jgi:hypothetical protein
MTTERVEMPQGSSTPSTIEGPRPSAAEPATIAAEPGSGGRPAGAGVFETLELSSEIQRLRIENAILAGVIMGLVACIWIMRERI